MSSHLNSTHYICHVPFILWASHKQGGIGRVELASRRAYTFDQALGSCAGILSAICLAFRRMIFSEEGGRHRLRKRTCGTSKPSASNIFLEANLLCNKPPPNMLSLLLGLVQVWRQRVWLAISATHERSNIRTSMCILYIHILRVNKGPWAIQGWVHLGEGLIQSIAPLPLVALDLRRGSSHFTHSQPVPVCPQAVPWQFSVYAMNEHPRGP